MSIDSGRLTSAILAKTAPEKTEEKDEGEDTGTPEGRLAAAEDIMDVLSSYGPSAVSDSASKVEKATQAAARRAKAKMLDQALSAWFDQRDSD